MTHTSTRLVAVLVLAAGLSTSWITLNATPSVPVGLYRRTAVPQPLTRGALVILPVPASMRAFHSRWLPLLKPVAAVAGETVCNVEDELWIAGEDYGCVYTESHGMPLPHLEGCHTVPAGHVFLASQAPRSLDSRYFSSVPLAAITAMATPLLTWR
jgi:conjugative transfer signal peptidase TraF